MINPRRELFIKDLNQPSTSFQIKPLRGAQFNITVTSLSALFQSSSCIMNETHPLYSSLIVNCVFNAFSAYTAIMLNILTIHAIRKTSSLPKPLKTLLLSLAVSDLGVGLLAQPLHIAQMVSPTDFTVITFYVIQMIFSVASFFTVVAISVDRFLAVHLHLRYQELVTHKRVVVVVISIWTLSVLYSSLMCYAYIYLNSEPVYVVSVIYGFCFIVTGIIHCRMYFTVRHHANEIQVLQMQVAQNSQIESAARKRKSAISMFYVYLVFLVCYLPKYCVIVAHLVPPPRTSLKNGLWEYSLSLVFLNSSLNPVIYGWKMRHIRHAMIDTLRNLFSRQNQANL